MKQDHPVCQTELSNLPYFEQELLALVHFVCQQQEHGLVVKCSKCTFGEHTVAHLGHVISEEGVAMDAAKVQAVLEWSRLQSFHDVHGFLELTSHYRRFIRDYGTPLTRLLCKVGFQWSNEAEEAFHKMQHVLTTTPVCSYPTSTSCSLSSEMSWAPVWASCCIKEAGNCFLQLVNNTSPLQAGCI
jgi:hypothetical protein